MSEEERMIRAALAVSMCPFCPAGPFRSVAKHSVQRHGIDRHALRDLAGVRVKDSICDPSLADDCRERGRIRGAPEPPRGPGSKSSRRKTVADKRAHEAQRRPRACRVCGVTTPSRGRRTCSAECLETFWVEAGEGTRGGVEERNPNAVLTRFLVQEIRERYAAEAVSQAALAADYGVNQGTISAVVRGETWENIDGPRQAPLSLSDRAKRKALL